jgi:hypothetical protein
MIEYINTSFIDTIHLMWCAATESDWYAGRCMMEATGTPSSEQCSRNLHRIA